MDTEEWDHLFKPGISAGGTTGGEAERAPEAYILQPVGGRLTYLRRGPNVRREESQAVQEADVNLDTVSLQITSTSRCNPPSRIIFNPFSTPRTSRPSFPTPGPPLLSQPHFQYPEASCSGW